MTQTELNEVFKKIQAEFDHGNYEEVKKSAAEIRRQLDESDENGDYIEFRVRTILLFLQALWKQGNYEEAANIASDAVDIVERISDNVAVKNILLARCYNMRGLAYWKLADFPAAIENYAQALDICESIGEKMGIAIATGNIGIIYCELDDFIRARRYYERALAIHKELGNPVEIAEVTCNLGVVYRGMNDYTAGLRYFSEALEMFEKLGNRAEASRMTANIGNIYHRQEEYDTAYKYCINALAVHEELGMKADIAVVKGLLGDICHRKASSFYNPQTAKQYILESIEIDEKTGAKSDLLENHTLLAELYRDEGNWQECIRHFELFLELERKVRGEDVAKMAQRFALERETAVMQREKEILKIKNEEFAELNKQLIHKNKRLRETDKEKNEFLGIVSHDLKNPLSAITMIANVLANEADTLTSQEIHEFADDIRSSSGRMFKLITDLLDINRIEDGFAVTDAQTAFADEAVRIVASHYREAAQAKGITINEQLAPAQLHASPSVLAQILDNLISNAVKYSLPDTEITLKTETDGKHVRISIADRGPGLTEEDKRNIFGKFKRLSAQPTGGEHSTGLGLSIVKKLAEAVGGEIRYESELGKGTTFTLELPA
ncbi:MAG: tetratricopeptide repeat-containing sensor histidine kinase [Bacteroidetes bacterium]|nr:tetratricopeptide repeat-containing sensor histidine kinase [Bacteroidota bacterium]